MLIGEYRHTIDPKKRLSIPSKLRKEMGEKVILSKGLDKCLFVFPVKDWEQFAGKLGTLGMGQQDTRGFARLFLSSATEVEFDQLGRVLVPDYLRDFAGLKKTAVIAGLFNRLEIWDEERWNEYKTNLEKNGDRIAEKLGELGIV